MSSQFLLYNDEADNSDLGRARSMTKTLEQKANAVVPINSINNEFAQVVTKLQNLHEQWTKRRMTRKVPILNIKYCDANELKYADAQNKVYELKAEKRQLATTVSSLFKEMYHLKQQNQSMSQRVEGLRKVLHESKSYMLSLKQRNDNLASDMDFQCDLHEKQRRVWKTQIRSAPTGPHIHENDMYSNSLMVSNTHNHNHQHMHMSTTHELNNILKEYETIIEQQREQIKYKNQQIEQQRNVFQHEKNQQYGELMKEINHLKTRKQQEMDELKMKIERHNTEIARSKQENTRLHKTLEVTHNELNANKKLIEATRPLNAPQTEQQLFQLEQDYLNLSEVLVACQHRVTQIEHQLNAKHRELDDAKRLKNQQNKAIAEYKKKISLLEANLAESKSDQSDLIEALQQEWEQCKEEVMRYKEKCRQLQHEKDELMIGTDAHAHGHAHAYDDRNRNGNGNDQSANAELVVLIDDLQRKLQQKEAEVASQEMLMAQLMEQQRAFQKRNKTLVGRLKAMKSQSQSYSNNRSSHLMRGIDEGVFDSFSYNNGHNSHNSSVQMPDNVAIELKSVYEHYMRNPMISQHINQMIYKIQTISSKIVDQHGDNDYILPDFGGRLRINSASTILVVMEDILVQRQTAIKAENQAMDKILCLKEVHEQSMGNLAIERKRLNGDIRKLTNQLAKYVEQIHDMEEQKLLYESQPDEVMLSDLDRLKRENERIAQEFLQCANLWNTEKAIMSAERAQIDNDLSYIVHSLDQLMVERQRFEQDADQFQGLYANLIAELRDKGMCVEVEYMDSDQYNHINGQALSQRRKRNPMRLKLYQTTTQPTGLKSPPLQQEMDSENEHIDDDNDNGNGNGHDADHVQQQQQQQQQRQQRMNIQINHIKTSSTSITSSSSSSSVPPHSHSQHATTSSAPSSPKRLSTNYSADNQINIVHRSVNRSKSAKPLTGLSKDRHKENEKGDGPKESIWKRMGKKMNKKDRDHDREIGREREREAPPSPALSVMNGMNIEDEADAYIPFDEPDEFNLLDQEYKKIAMSFVEAENDIFDITDNTILNGLNNDDVTLLAQEVLSHELQRKQQKLPVLQGWIEKKSPTFARGWQKRWVIVREYNIFYGKTKTDIKDIKNEAERKKFLNAIPLLVVQYIVGTDHSRSGRKFEIVARDPRTGDRRHYQWKAGSREECDKWVHGLNAHKKLLAARLQFLANTNNQPY